MDCLLSLIASCLLSNTYVTGGIEVDVQGTPKEGYWCSNHWCRGPLGVLRVGTKLDLTPRMQLDFGAMHSSFMEDSKDKGRESLYLSVTWRPFRN